MPNDGWKIRGTKVGLDDLKQLRKQLRHNQEEAARHERAAATASRTSTENAAEQLENLLKMVTPLRQDSRVRHTVTPSLLASELRRAAALGETAVRADFGVSDEEEVTHLLSEGGTAYVCSDIAPDTARNLRRGQWRTRAELDLHGSQIEQARHALVSFLDKCQEHGVRCIRIVHGKGYGSSGMAPILKDKVRSGLIQKYEVQAFFRGSRTRRRCLRSISTLASTGRKP